MAPRTRRRLDVRSSPSDDQGKDLTQELAKVETVLKKKQKRKQVISNFSPNTRSLGKGKQVISCSTPNTRSKGKQIITCSTPNTRSKGKRKEKGKASEAAAQEVLPPRTSSKRNRKRKRADSPNPPPPRNGKHSNKNKKRQELTIAEKRLEDGLASESEQQQSPPTPHLRKKQRVSKHRKHLSFSDPVTVTADDAADSKTEEEKKKNRVWSQSDEIIILQGLIKYMENNGIVPTSAVELNAFYDLIKHSVHINANNNQLADKVRKLKKKYHKVKNGDERVLSKAHGFQVFQLSKQIWGTQSGVRGGESNSFQNELVIYGSNLNLNARKAEIEKKLKEIERKEMEIQSEKFELLQQLALLEQQIALQEEG